MTFCRGQLLAPKNFFNTGVYFCEVNSFWFMTPVEVEAAPVDEAEVAVADPGEAVVWCSMAFRFLKAQQ